MAVPVFKFVDKTVPNVALFCSAPRNKMADSAKKRYLGELSKAVMYVCFMYVLCFMLHANCFILLLSGMDVGTTLHECYGLISQNWL